MRDIWTAWDWRKDPDAPLTWEHPERMVVTADGIDSAIVSEMPRGVVQNEYDALNMGAVVIVVETPEMMVDMDRDRGGSWASPRRIPALRVERQADLDGDALRALCAVKAQHRVLVISPREEIALDGAALFYCDECRRGPFGPGAVEDSLSSAMGGRPWRECCGRRIDLVVVRGPTGQDAWPMHPAWVRQIKTECGEAGVAFALMSWGDWKPTASVATWEQGGVRTYEEQGVAMLSDGRIILEDEPAETIRARDRAAGHHVYSPAIERDQTAIACMRAEWRRAEKERRAPRPPYDEIAWFYRVGAARSGRMLWLRGPDGGLVGKPAEYLALPEGLR